MKLSTNTFKLTEDQEELIHRIFGGEKTINSSVESVNTGGNVMNDLYLTENGRLVVVFEYGAYILPDRDTYWFGSYLVYDIEGTEKPPKDWSGVVAPMFHWDEPLDYA